jgi:hypothetical protein
MRILIIPDVHLRLSQVKSILSKFEAGVDRVVFLGDYFDNFKETVESNIHMAKWLKIALYNPKYVFICGNHDMYYRYPQNGEVRNSGFTQQKLTAIGHVLTKEDWDRMPYYHFADNFYFAHGGIAIEVFCHPIHGFTRKYLDETIAMALVKVECGDIDYAFLPGTFHGGDRQGGITWLRWYDEFKPIGGINQIVGHSPHKEPQEFITPSSKNYCLDTGLHHVGILNDGIMEFVKLEWRDGRIL